MTAIGPFAAGLDALYRVDSALVVRVVLDARYGPAADGLSDLALAEDTLVRLGRWHRSR